MLIKSIFRLKTYIAVLLISLIIFSISIPLSITLAQGYGESRAKIYGELLRPNAVLSTELYLDDTSLKALYIILTNNTPGTDITLKDMIQIYESIYNIVYEPWLDQEKDNPIYLNSSSPLFLFTLGEVTLYDYTIIDLNNMVGAGNENNILDQATRSVAQSVIDKLNDLAKKNTGQPQFINDNDEYYGNAYDIGVGVNLINLDENKTIVMGTFTYQLDIVVFKNLTDLWHLGLNPSIDTPGWQNTVFISNDTRLTLQILGLYNDSKLIIGKNVFNAYILNKTVKSPYSDYYSYGYMSKYNTGTIYVPLSLLPEFLRGISSDQMLALNSFFEAFVTSFTYYYGQPIVNSDVRNLSLYVLDKFDKTPIIGINPYVLFQNGYVDINNTTTIKQIIIEAHNITGFPVDNLTSLYNTIYIEGRTPSNYIKMNILVEYDATYIYSNPLDNILNNTNAFYLSLIDKIFEFKSYIYDKINETNTSIEPFKSLYQKIITGDNRNTYTQTYQVSGPYYGGGSELKYHTLMAPGINVYGILFSLSSDRIYNLINLRMQSWDPIGAMSLVSLIPIVLLIGYTTSGEALSLIIATSRRWLAVSLSRGAYLKKFLSKLKILLVLIGIGIAILGIAISSIISVNILGLSVDLTTFIESQYKSFLILLPTVLLVPLVTYAATRNSLKQVENLSPLEAIRPVESIEKATTSRRKTVGSLIILLFTLISLTLGITRPNVEDLFDQLASRFGGAGVAVLGMILFGGIMIAPFVPLIVVYYSTKYLSEEDHLFNAIDKLVSKIFARSSSGSLAVYSSYRIRDLLKSPMRSSVISLSIMLGTLLSEAAMIKIIYPWITEYNTGNPLAVSGILSASNILIAVGLVGVAALIAVYPAVMTRTFDYIKGHVAILRVRGADKRTLISYVYISFLPSLIALLVSSLITALVFLVSMDSALGVAFLDSWTDPDFNMPHLYPYLFDWQIFLTLGVVLFVLILPAILAYRVATVRDLARYLKEEVF
ncbi:MAG: hypothetical protein F7C36_08185 [Desulfurococcales archaeon]|nr:hypothetical protein [Desulfurococcales archaeon]